MERKSFVRKIAHITFLMLFCANVAATRAAEPTIVLSHLPPIGQTGHAVGTVVWDELTAENAGQYAVIAMLHATWLGGGDYYVKPYYNNYLTSINAFGSFSMQITTDPADANVDEVVFYFVERTSFNGIDGASLKPVSMTGKYLVTTTVRRSTWVSPPEAPVSNIRPGLVAAGTEITLSCQEGGAIFYTLDGSNPVSSATAQLYENKELMMPESGVLFVKAVVKISDVYSSVASFVWLPEEPLSTPFWGLNVSLVLNGEYFGYPLTEAITRERMLPVVPLTKWVRTFGTINNGQEYINQIAKELGLRTMIGVYITNDASNNNAQIEGLRQILQAGPAPDLIAIGNETSLLGVNPATLASSIDAVREMVLEQGLITPVGSVDIAGVSWSQSLLEKLDFMGMNIYHGTWDNIPENQMIDATKQTYSSLLSTFPSKLILLTETGTPYSGGQYSVSGGKQTPSEEKAAGYLCGFLDWIQQTHIPAFYFEAYDEPIKSMNGGHPIEQYFGLMNGDGEIHSFYCNCIYHNPCDDDGDDDGDDDDGDDDDGDDDDGDDDTSIPIHSTDIITLYPNPTTGKIHLETDCDIKVYNMQGIVLQEFYGNQVDLSVYPQAIYLLQVNGTWSKVVKK